MKEKRLASFSHTCLKMCFLVLSEYNYRFKSIRMLSRTNALNLKLVQFVYKNRPNEIRAGYLQAGEVVDVNKIDCIIPSTVIDILKCGHLCNVFRLACSKNHVEPKSTITMMAPITGMDKVLCIGLNYFDHYQVHKLERPKVPIFFSKFASNIVGPNATVRIRTGVTEQVDWEVELVAVIGYRCSNVKACYAMNYISGYTIAQDISSRDWQKQNGGQFLLGKVQDGFCPIGPYIVTCDEVGNPDNLNIECSVNGIKKQDSNTCNMIYNIPTIIERLTSVMTLFPGDIILTGTPAGVGVHRKPPEFLYPGDELRSEIENIGSFTVKFDCWSN